MRVVFQNVDTEGVMEWTFDSEVTSRLVVSAFFMNLGEVPDYGYSEKGDLMFIRLTIAQINRIREKLKNDLHNPGVAKVYNDMTFLLTCSGFIKVK